MGVFTANPLFYMISGYLFFYKPIDSVWEVFPKIRKRFKTLFIPFVIAACVFVATFIVIQHLPGASAHINSVSYTEQLRTLPLGDILLSMFYMANGTHYPWAFHLWFLRDLCIIVALSPLLYLMRKYLRWWCIPLTLAFHLLCSQYIFSWGLFWFMLGSLTINKLDQMKSWIYPCLFFVLVVCKLLWFNHKQIFYTEVFILFLGYITYWNIYDRIVPPTFRLKDNKWLSMACGYVFFVYLFHDPVIQIFMKGIPVIMGGPSNLSYTVAYFVSPCITYLLFMGIGRLLDLYCHPLYKVLIGGR